MMKMVIQIKKKVAGTAARMVFWVLWFRTDKDCSIISPAGFARAKPDVV